MIWSFPVFLDRVVLGMEGSSLTFRHGAVLIHILEGVIDQELGCVVLGRFSRLDMSTNVYAQ